MPQALKRPEPLTLDPNFVSAFIVVLSSASIVWAYVGLTRGPNAAMLAMQMQGWLIPILTLVGWVGNQGYDLLKAHFTGREQATIRENQRSIASLTKQVTELQSTVNVLNRTIDDLNKTIDDDRQTQVNLRRDITDLRVRLSRYEQHTPNPDV